MFSQHNEQNRQNSNHSPLLRTNHVVRVGSDGSGPRPGGLVPDDPQFDSLLGVQTALLVGPAYHYILPLGEPANIVRVIAKGPVFSNLQKKKKNSKFQFKISSDLKKYIYYFLACFQKILKFFIKIKYMKYNVHSLF